MTYAPESLMDAREYIIREYGVAAASVGIIGGPNHRGGYHCGADRTINGDYSVVESPRDRRGLTDAASALDVGTFTKGGRDLRQFSAWLVDQCRAGAPDTADIREVIYSTDGRTVRRWDRLGRRSTGDDSHLWHTHISYFRDSEKRDKTKLFSRYMEGDTTMDLTDAVRLPQWALDRWPDLATTINVNTALGSGYGHARSAKDEVYREAGRAADRHRETTATLAAILAAVGGDDLGAIRDMVRSELDRAARVETEQRTAELAALAHTIAGPLAERVAARLGDIAPAEIGQAIAEEFAAILAAGVGQDGP